MVQSKIKVNLNERMEEGASLSAGMEFQELKKVVQIFMTPFNLLGKKDGTRMTFCLFHLWLLGNARRVLCVSSVIAFFESV